MGLHRWDAKRDAAEAPIVDAIRSVGGKVWRLSGDGVPDLLVLFRARWHVGEVKTGNARPRANQGDFPIWRTPADALSAIGAVR